MPRGWLKHKSNRVGRKASRGGSSRFQKKQKARIPVCPGPAEIENPVHTPPTIDASVVSIADSLIPDILKNISMFLGFRDALNFSTSSKRLHQSIGLGAVNHAVFFPLLVQAKASWHDRDDSYHIWRNIDPIFPDRVHSIHFSCRIKDQGWGNRKGRLSISEIDDTEWKSHLENENQIKSNAIRKKSIFQRKSNAIRKKWIFQSPTSGHDFTTLQFEFKPLPGKVYSIWYKVGGGGGHSLHIEDMKIRSLIYDPICAKLMNSNLPVKNIFFQKMFMAVLEIFSRSSIVNVTDGGTVTTITLPLEHIFESIGIPIRGDLEQMESMKRFIKECERFNETGEFGVSNEDTSRFRYSFMNTPKVTRDPFGF
eukprot:205873_1